MDVAIAPTYYSGLRHAGDEPCSSLPDSASKIGRQQIDCVIQGDGLYVVKALGHPQPIGAG